VTTDPSRIRGPVSLCGVLAGLSCLLLLAMSAPGFPIWGLLVGLVWVATAIVWIVLALIAIRAGFRDGAHALPRVHALGLVAVLAVAVSIPTFAPLRVRFALSKGAMQATADECLRTASEAEPCEVHGRVGLYLATTGTERDGNAVVYVSGMSLMDSGFVYASDGVAPPSSGDFERPDYVNLGGGWFAFTASF
jgi:hypothetical protein